MVTTAVRAGSGDRFVGGVGVATRTRIITRSVAVATPALASTAVLAWAASDRPMTMDESFTLLTVDGSFGAFVGSLRLDPGMAVYYAVARGWAQLGGGSLGSLRLLSTLAVMVAVVGMAYLAVSRRRSWFGVAATVAVAFAPMVREASVDARAGALGAAAAIWLTIAFDRILRRPDGLSSGVVRGLVAASVAAAFIHPSTLFLGAAGLVATWRHVRRSGGRDDRAWVLGGGLGLVVGAAVAAWQSPAAAAVADGVGGVEVVFAQLPGGRWTAGLALLATSAVLFAGRAFDHERPLRNFGGAALIWFALCLFALPVRDVFVPRYFVAAGVLVVATVIVAALERWNRPVILAILAIAALGGIEHAGDRYGYGSTWCDAARLVADGVAPGDRVVFGNGQQASAVTGCLGAGATAAFADADLAPAAIVGRLDDARALWTSPAPTEMELLRVSLTGRTAYVWANGDPRFTSLMAELAGYGVRCEITPLGSAYVSWCETGVA